MLNSIISFIFLSVVTCYAQTPRSLFKTYESFHLKNANDSKGVLDAGKVYTIRLNASPQGSGEHSEVAGGTNLFPEENNIVWLKFFALKDSRLTIRIVPDSTDNDYDFLLFRDEGEGSLSNISSKRQKPLRSNCSRTQNKEQGVTGLKYGGDVPDHVGAGIGSSFSRGIDVKRGEEYYLVLNNVYDEGSGVTIFLEYWDSKVLSGITRDEQENPIASHITWEDKATGDVLAETDSDSETGKFELEVPYSVQSEDGYTLVAESDTLSFTEIEYTVGKIATCSPEPLLMVIPKLNKGSRVVFGSINFVPNKAEFLSSANSSLRRLHRLMKKNPYMKIRIEGHTHGSNSITQKLSEDRATAVKNYLIEKGIASSRMTTVGHSGKYMLYPLDAGRELASKNRRVEIMVTDY